MGANLFSASEISLARSRVQSLNLLKTLFLLEHLPRATSCRRDLHVLGLVFFNASQKSCALPLRLTANRLQHLLYALPIQFRCQTSIADRCFASARALRLLKPCRDQIRDQKIRSPERELFPGRRPNM